jgi:HEAT repeat protein
LTEEAQTMATKRKAAKKTRRAARRGGSPKTTAHRAVAIAANPRRGVKERTAAAAAAPLAVCESERDFQAMLKVLRNANESVKVRLAALQALQAASFSVLAFEGCRGDYIATLRQVADDPDPELRQRVLGMLMREKDGFAQKKLLEGLHEPDKALVPPEKALQLLGNDVHADVYKVARAIVRKPPNEAARREALRLLAADATAAPLFEKLLLAKDELREIRQIAASALYALRPDRMQKHARDILLDKSDYDDIKATSLAALTQLGDETISDDKALMTSVDRFSMGKTPVKYKQTARRFLSRYGRGG